MNRVLFALLAMVALASPSFAQQTKAQMNSYNNTNITANGQNAITGQIVNTMNNQMINSMCGLAQASDCVLPPGAAAGNGAVPHVSNLAALRAASTVSASVLVRDSYAVPGDAPFLAYVWQSTCPGTPDNVALYIAPSAGGSGCWSAAQDPNVGNVREWGAVCDAQVTYTYITLTAGSSNTRSMITSAPFTVADVGKNVLLSIGAITTNGPSVGVVQSVTPGSPFNTVVLSAVAGAPNTSSTFAITNWAHDDTSAINAAIAANQGYRTIILPGLCGIASTINLTASGAVLYGTIQPYGFHNGPTPFNVKPSSGFVWLAGASTMFQQTTPDAPTNLQSRYQSVTNLSLYGGVSASVGRNVVTISNSTADNIYTTDIAANGYNFLYGAAGPAELYEVASTCYNRETNLVASTVLDATHGSIGFGLTGNRTSKVQGASSPWNTCNTNFDTVTVLFGATDAVQCLLADHNNFTNLSLIGNGANTGPYSLHLSGFDTTYFCEGNLFKRISVNLGVGGASSMGLIRNEANASGNTVEQLDNYAPPSGWLPSVIAGSIFSCTWDNGGQCNATPVASLPACVSTFQANTRGKLVLVSDASATTFNAIVAGGGANTVNVLCDGTNWRIH